MAEAEVVEIKAEPPDLKVASVESQELLRDALKDSAIAKALKLARGRGEGKMKTVSKNKQYGDPSRCNICGKMLCDRSGLLRHLAVHTGEFPYACTRCPRAFNMAGNLRKHERRVHDKLRPYRCDECPGAFYNRPSLEAHLRVHTGERPFVCTECGKTFNRPDVLKQHMYIHTGEKPYSCAVCGYTCRDQSTLRKHKQRHTSTLKRHECAICHKRYDAKSKLKLHVAEVHLHADVRRLECHDCGRRFKTRQLITSHIKMVHLKLVQWECSVCARLFSMEYNLHTHMASHSRERPHACEQCTNTYKTKSDLAKHLKLHGPPPFTCERCGRGFYRRVRFERHERSAHRPRLKLTPCPLCHVCFYNQNYVNTHMRKVHGADREVYECHHCGASVRNKPAMVSHLRRHTRGRKYACRVCGVKFLRAHRMRRHVRRKHRESTEAPAPMVKIKEELLDIEENSLPQGSASGDDEEEGAPPGLREAREVIRENAGRLARVPEHYFDKFFVVKPKQPARYIMPRTLYAASAVPAPAQPKLERRRPAAERAAHAQRPRRDTKPVDYRDMSSLYIEENPPQVRKRKSEIEPNLPIKLARDDKPLDALNSNTAKPADTSSTKTAKTADTLDPRHKSTETLNSRHKPTNTLNSTHKSTDTFDSRHKSTKTLDSRHKSTDTLDSTHKSTKTLDSRHKSTDTLDSTHKSTKTLDSRHKSTDTLDSTQKSTKTLDSRHKSTKTLDSRHKSTDSCNVKTPTLRLKLSKFGGHLGDEDKMADGDKRKKSRGRRGFRKPSYYVSKCPIKFGTEQCYTCFKLFPTYEALVQHCREHFNTENAMRITKCPFCSYEGKPGRGLWRHVREEHNLDLTIPSSELHIQIDAETNETKYVASLGKKNYRKAKKNKNVYESVDKIEIEIVPTVKSLNHMKARELEKKKKVNKMQTVQKRKLVRKGDAWVIESEVIPVTVSTLTEGTEKSVKDLVKSGNRDKEDLTDDPYLEKIIKLSKRAKAMGKTVLFPCDKCDKVCQALCGLRLHRRVHNSNAKPFKPKIWKNGITKKAEIEEDITHEVPKDVAERIDQLKARERLEKAKPILPKRYQCDEKLKKFFEDNVTGKDVDFEHFLKAYRKVANKKVEDLQEVNSWGVVTDENNKQIKDNTRKTKTIQKPKITANEYRKRMVRRRNEMREKIRETLVKQKMQVINKTLSSNTQKVIQSNETNYYVDKSAISNDSNAKELHSSDQMCNNKNIREIDNNNTPNDEMDGFKNKSQNETDDRKESHDSNISDKTKHVNYDDTSQEATTDYVRISHTKMNDDKDTLQDRISDRLEDKIVGDTEDYEITSQNDTDDDRNVPDDNNTLQDEMDSIMRLITEPAGVRFEEVNISTLDLNFNANKTNVNKSNEIKIVKVESLKRSERI